VNLDDELRRIFSDEERLDLPLRDDAVASVVTGARRIRRRRLAAIAASGTLVAAMLAGGAVVLSGLGAPEPLPPVGQAPTAVPTTVGPTTSAPAAPGSASQGPPPQGTASKTITHRSSTPPPPKVPIGPNGYNGLALGMTAQVAESTGTIVANSEPTSSKGCLGYDYKGSPNLPNHYSVLISPTVGVVRIAGRSDAITPEGLTVGASESEMRRLYPVPSNGHRGTDEWVTAVPANSAAQYWIIVRNQSVAEIRIELKSQDCYL
jgi:hypothetical protein